MIVAFVGSLAGACFAACGVPAAIRFWRAGAAPREMRATAVLIVLGGLLMWFYLFALYGLNWLLVVNYTVEVVSWLVVLLLTIRK